MPTYEYACKACGEHLEVVQSFKDDPLTECPNCTGELRKVFSPIGIAFKGSGFYKTDSRSSGSKKAAESKSESTSSETKSSETKSSESKAPEKKPSEKKSEAAAS
jgi:putative FmdB family regulatory protein